MKAVILAGGFGTRISEETSLKPKPMVEIGERPILWHIMKIYSHYGVNDFIICLGYKGYVIKEYFANYFLHMSDITLDIRNNKMEIHNNQAEPWKVTLVHTGDNVMTGGRLRRILPHVKDEEAFCLTYGDGVADIDINALIQFHKKEKRSVTVTAVRQPGRFGALIMDGSKVNAFVEKPPGDGHYINGGFFVVSPKAVDFVTSDDMPWEREPLEKLAAQGQLSAFCHDGFWQPVDTLRDKRFLEGLWNSGNPPWKVW